MYQHNTYRRVSYGDTDRMGYLYYGKYAEYYEIARVESLRKLGIRYRDMEDVDEVILPVTEMSVKYLRPAKYDDVVRIETTISKMPDHNIHFTFHLYNEENELLNRAQVTLAFVDKSSGKRCAPPQELLNKMQPFFE